MEVLSSGELFLGRLLLGVVFLGVLFMPAWWLAGRIQEGKAHAFFRGLVAIGLALVGYLSFVNLLGRLLSQSLTPVWIYLALNAAACVVLWRRHRAELNLRPLLSSWRTWIGPAD